MTIAKKKKDRKKEKRKKRVASKDGIVAEFDEGLTYM